MAALVAAVRSLTAFSSSVPFLSAESNIHGITSVDMRFGLVFLHHCCLFFFLWLFPLNLPSLLTPLYKCGSQISLVECFLSDSESTSSFLHISFLSFPFLRLQLITSFPPLLSSLQTLQYTTPFFSNSFILLIITCVCVCVYTYIHRHIFLNTTQSV